MLHSIIMKNIIFIFLFFQLVSCTNAQVKNEKQHLAICTQGKGCEFSEITLSAHEVDKLLRKSNFWTTANANATLILEKCQSKKDETQTLEDINRSYEGSDNAIVLKKIDLEKYLKENDCFRIKCPNETKKITFHVSSKEFSGNGYFYLNLKAGEAFMPNASFQQLLAQQGVGQLTIDQLIRNGKMENYVINEGKKYQVSKPIGIDMSAVIKNDAINANRFKNDFRKTGNTRKHLNTSYDEIEFIGTDDEGQKLNIWIVPSYDVCLPPGKFDAHGFYNIGYISVDGVTYLITEMTGSSVQIKLTDISNGTYDFNPTGYQAVNLPGM